MRSGAGPHRGRAESAGSAKVLRIRSFAGIAWERPMSPSVCPTLAPNLRSANSNAPLLLRPLDPTARSHINCGNRLDCSDFTLRTLRTSLD